MASDRVIAALDIGSSKLCCIIAVLGTESRLRVIGVSHHASAGVKNGTIIDMEATFNAIMNAVHSAEQMANVTLTDVVVSLAGAKIESHLNLREMNIGGGAVREQDVKRLLHDSRLNGQIRDHELIHAIPVGYSVDGTASIKDPVGMHGDRLSVNMHFVNMRETNLRNIMHCVARCHLTIKHVTASAYASGLACLTEEERDLGTLLIDFGGGTTSLAVFYEGALIHTSIIPVGGMHVTNDIARGLSTPIDEAEKLKCRFGSAMTSSDDDREFLEVPTLGDPNDVPNSIPRSYLTSIIAPRIEETLELVRDHLDNSGVSGYAGPQIAITGGACQLQGVSEITSRILNRQVRVARPMGITGLKEANAGPAFSCAVGMLQFATNDRGEARLINETKKKIDGGLVSRVGHWVKDTFF